MNRRQAEAGIHGKSYKNDCLSGLAPGATLSLWKRKGLWKWRRRGKRGKAQAAFPLFPPPLGNLAKGARFPHSHSLASPRMGKWETKIRFPTFPRGARNDGPCFGIFRAKIQERNSAAPRPPSHRFSGSCCIGNETRFQDHRWIRKCRDQREQLGSTRQARAVLERSKTKSQNLPNRQGKTTPAGDVSNRSRHKIKSERSPGGRIATLPVPRLILR